MSVIQPVIEKMKEIVPELPEDWAAEVAARMGIKAEVVRSYVRGDRGNSHKSKKKKALEMLRHMKDLQQEFKTQIEEAVQ